MIEPGKQLEAMRSTAPLVHNITNYVSMNIMANVLLSAGASPAMVHAEEEAADFAAIAHALTINIGTLSTPWVNTMLAAAKTANENNTPWVLDPVAAGATRFRSETSEKLLKHQPTVIKGNASEILALAGTQGAGKGVDATDGVEAAEQSAQALANATGSVVAVTGENDYITDSTQAYRIGNGHETMPLITALGCSLGGVIAAFCAAGKPMDATVSAIAYYGLAGEIAAKQSTLPGGFATAFVDALHSINHDQLSAGAKIEAA